MNIFKCHCRRVWRPLLVQLVLVPYGVLSQSFDPSNTVSISQAFEIAIRHYSAEIGDHTMLYNGGRYVSPLRTTDQHPYLIDDKWHLSSIVYFKERYDSIHLRYDLSSDCIVIKSPRGDEIELVSEKIDRYSLLGREFARLRSDAAELPLTGFYEVLYNGKHRLYAKREKLLDKQLDPLNTIIEYEEKNRYFLFKDGKYHNIKSRRMIVNLLSDQKTNLDDFFRKNRVRFRANKEASFVELLAYYETLLKK